MKKFRPESGKEHGWLNSTVVGAGITSFLGDLSYESVESLLPSFLISIGAPVYALGLIEGLSDGLSSFTKLFSGYYSDVFGKRRDFAIAGYVLSGIYPFFAAVASSWLVVLFGKVLGWFGKGLRGPPRDSIIASSVQEKDLGKAFGFHRAADTLGSVAGPACVLVLFAAVGFGGIFALAGAVGLLSAAAFAYLVKGSGPKASRKRPGIVASVSGVPPRFKGFLKAVFLFGLADFSHALLVLLAVSRLSPQLGLLSATAAGVLLYGVRNAAYALACYPAGWLGDRFGGKGVLTAGYALAVVVFAGFMLLPASLPFYLALFALAGVFTGFEDALESSIAARLAGMHERGTAFGVLATVNGVGDLVSSVLVGLIWAAYGFTAGLAFALVFAVAGAATLAAL